MFIKLLKFTNIFSTIQIKNMCTKNCVQVTSILFFFYHSTFFMNWNIWFLIWFGTIYYCFSHYLYFMKLKIVKPLCIQIIFTVIFFIWFSLWIEMFSLWHHLQQCILYPYWGEIKYFFECSGSDVEMFIFVKLLSNCPQTVCFII